MGSDFVPRHIAEIVPYLPGKPVEELERELGIPAGQSVKLASNENPLGPSPKALDAIRAALSETNRYPEGSSWALRKALAGRHGVSMEEIVVGAGSNELINLLLLAFALPGENVVLSAESFICYELGCRLTGTEFKTVPMCNHTFDLEAMARAVDGKTKLIFIANPNNPTGTYVGSSALGKLIEGLPRRVILAVDEAYFEYVDADDYPNSLDYRSRHPRLVTLRTFSKIYGLAGLRVGYAIASKEITQYLHRVRAPFNVSTLAQVAATAALDDRQHVSRARKENASERARMAAALRKLGCEVVPSQTNFLLVEPPRDAEQVYQSLLRKGVIVRPVANYGLPTHLRISIGDRVGNDRLLLELGGLL